MSDQKKLINPNKKKVKVLSKRIMHIYVWGFLRKIVWSFMIKKIEN